MIPHYNQTRTYLTLATIVILVIFLGVISFDSGLFVFNTNVHNQISADETKPETIAINCFPQVADTSQDVVGPCGHLHGIVLGYPDGTSSLTRVVGAAVTVSSFGVSSTVTTDEKGEYDISAIPVIQNKPTSISINVAASGQATNSFKGFISLQAPTYESLYPIYLSGTVGQ